MSLLKTALERFLILIFSLLVMAVIWQILSRYILSRPSTITEELARFLLIWLATFGASYTFIERGHLSIDLISEKLSSLGRERLASILSLVTAAFGVILTFGGCLLVYRMFELNQLTPALEIPMAFIYLAAPINGLIILYYSFFEFKGRSI